MLLTSRGRYIKSDVVFVHWSNVAEGLVRRVRLDYTDRVIYNLPGVVKEERLTTFAFIVKTVPVQMQHSRLLREAMPVWVLLLQQQERAELFSGPLHYTSCKMCSFARTHDIPTDGVGGSHVYRCQCCLVTLHDCCTAYLWDHTDDCPEISFGQFCCPVCLMD